LSYHNILTHEFNFSQGKIQALGIIIEKYPYIPGCDVAGEVYEVGPGVTNFKKGDRVMG